MNMRALVNRKQWVAEIPSCNGAFPVNAYYFQYGQTSVAFLHHF
jgi:hypothetical protein